MLVLRAGGLGVVILAVVGFRVVGVTVAILMGKGLEVMGADVVGPGVVIL